MRHGEEGWRAGLGCGSVALGSPARVTVYEFLKGLSAGLGVDVKVIQTPLSICILRITNEIY